MRNKIKEYENILSNQYMYDLNICLNEIYQLIAFNKLYINSNLGIYLVNGHKIHPLIKIINDEFRNDNTSNNIDKSNKDWLYVGEYSFYYIPPSISKFSAKYYLFKNNVKEIRRILKYQWDENYEIELKNKLENKFRVSHLLNDYKENKYK